jgi:hypothetical protein
MAERTTAPDLGSEFHAAIAEILADRGTVWVCVDSDHQAPIDERRS